MADYTMAQARRDFERGYIKGANVVRSFQPGVWNVWIMADSLGGNGFLVDARRGEVRDFLTVSAAVGALEKIGFSVEGLSVLR